MNTPHTTPWHRASFDHFLHHRLPDLLTDRLGLAGYRAESVGPRSCRILLRIHTGPDAFDVDYPSLPAPDEAGVFHWNGVVRAPRRPHPFDPATAQAPETTPGEQRFAADGTEWVVLPVADRDDLDRARIDCVGEQLCDFIEARLGRIPPDVELEEALVRSLVPLDMWFHAFLAQAAQRLGDNNWLDRATHLRRLLLPDRQEVFTPGHFGRTCPFETAEGPNVGRVLTISRGAEVRDGRLVIVDEEPAAGLGFAAAAVPFLEHDDGNRVLMGVNMMRQWLPPAEREPALVQTGLEPADADFWCGRNLLTAYLSWDGDAFEDALVLSASAARKLACPDILEPGDKLSNRHGAKGVVARVLPDQEMPRLPDGTAVELIYSICGVPSRWTMGQLREAALSHAARQDGRTAIVPPFQAPSDDRLRQRLRAAGLPDSGMLILTDGGTRLRRPCTVGWVYWGCTIHLARAKLHTATATGEQGQRLGSMEVQALREAGAEAVIQELTNTCAAERDDPVPLAQRVAAGEVAPARTPSPRFATLAARLAAAGIRAEVDCQGVTFGPAGDGPATLTLALPVPDPWLPEQDLQKIHARADLDGCRQVIDANTRLARLLAEGAPPPLTEAARAALGRAVALLYDELLTPQHLRFGNSVLFSGRTVIVPGPDLSIHQLGLPEEMAWPLFGPQVSRRLDDSAATARRTPLARAALADVMASMWIILNRAPTVSPTSLLAFQPVLSGHRALRVHPLACRMLHADFDGDQAALFLPLTRTAMAAARDHLSIAGHLRRDPDLVEDLVPAMDALFGLACLSRSAKGRDALAAAVAGAPPVLRDGIWTRHGVAGALRDLLARQGVDAVLEAAAKLMHLGFAAARREGASLGPFLGTSLALPEPPAGDDIDQWQAYMEEVHGLVAGFRDYDDEDLGAVCLLSHCGARGSVAQVAALLAPGGLVHTARGDLTPIRHGWREGLAPQEVHDRVVGARRGLFRMHGHTTALGAEQDLRTRPAGYGVLARARRCDRPGVAFARAARRGETDPLRDEYARLFVGLPAAGGSGS